MVKFKVMDKDGRTFVGLGLSFANLRKFLAEPMDTYIMVKGSDIDIPFDIMVFSGETEEDIEANLRKGGMMLFDERTKS
jgi:hypothetical protein